MMPVLRDATFDDYAGVAELQRRNRLLPIKTEEQWRHLWIDNPAYVESKGRAPIGWVLEVPEHRIVGYIGTIPLRYEMGWRSIIAAAGHSWVVDHGFRSVAPLLVDQFLSQDRVDLFIMATVNEEAAQCLSTFATRRVPAGVWNRASFWITNFQGFTAAWLRRRRVLGAGVISRFASVAGIPRLGVHKRRLRRSAEDVRVHFCDRIDERFDVFWTELKRRYPTLLLGVRSAEELQWHFGPAIKANQAWILTAGNNGRLAAYGIFYRHDSKAYGLTRMRMVDFQSLNGNCAPIPPILACAFDRCVQEGIDMLEVIGLAPAKRAVVDGLAPFRRSLPAWLFHYRVRNDELDRVLLNPSAWDASQYDGDASL